MWYYSIITNFLDVKNWAAELDPVFNFCHILLVVYYFRLENEETPEVWAGFISCLISSNAGSFLIGVLSGGSGLDAFQDDRLFVILIVIYFTMFYCPQDIGYKVSSNFIVFFTANVLTEIYRVLKISEGLDQGMKMYPQSFFAPLIIAIIKGNGSAWIKPIRSVITGNDYPNEFLFPSPTTKGVVIGALAIRTFVGQVWILWLLFLLFLYLKLNTPIYSL